MRELGVVFMVMQESERPEVGIFGLFVESLELALPKIFWKVK